MHNIKTNFDRFCQIVKHTLSDKLNAEGNLQFYPRQPKMNDCSIIALAICAESISIDSENYLWSKIKKDHHKDFPDLIDRSNFNKRRRRLRLFIHQVSLHLSQQLNKEEDVYLVDSIPVPICRIAREQRCKFGKEKFETAPDKGYSAVSKSYYYGYKLHMVTSVSGVFHSIDLSKASVHDVYFLQNIKHSNLNDALLIADKGYISKEMKTDLFHACNIQLATPSRSNQKEQSTWCPVFRKSRKRIETLFSQLCDQMMLKRNYAKTVDGLITRLFTKISAITVLQFINYSNNKPLNHLKHALAF